MQDVLWVKPALLWGAIEANPNTTLTDYTGAAPQLLEFKTDNFLPEFLSAMNPPPDELGAPQIADTAYFQERLVPTSQPKLYQPFHSRFYLVTASLVCKVPGLPDKVVVRKSGEKVAFVIRRVKGSAEQGWSEKTGWSSIQNPQAAVLLDEERFPLQPLSVPTIQQPTAFESASRTVFHGYIVAGNREKYNKVDTNSDQFKFLNDNRPASEKVREYQNQVNADEDGVEIRLNEFDTKVLSAWNQLVAELALTPPETINVISTGLIIDFGDFLARALPAVWTAIKTTDYARIASENGIEGDWVQRTTVAAFDKLLEELLLVRFPGATGTSIAQAMYDNRVIIEQNASRGAVELPTHTYNLSTLVRMKLNASNDFDGSDNITMTTYVPGLQFNPATNKIEPVGTLIKLVETALNAESAPMRTSATPDDSTTTTVNEAVLADEAEAEKLVDLIKNVVKPAPALDANGNPTEDKYFIRLIYEYQPDCPPILSDRSQMFMLAPMFDPDAPPRFVNIQMPSIRPTDLRKYAKGVGLQMNKELRKVMDGVHEGMLAGEGLNAAPEFNLAIVCSFSIQIITLVALVVMFIFLILLNIVFWWLPILKICLPIPKPK